MYGRKKIRQSMNSAVYHLRSRHPNCPRTEHVPATVVLGRTVGRLRKQQAKELASEIEMVVNQFDIYMKISGQNLKIYK